MKVAGSLLLASAFGCVLSLPAAPHAQADVGCSPLGRAQEATRLTRVEAEFNDPRGDQVFAVSWSILQEDRIVAADRPVLGADVRILRCLPEGRWAVVALGRAERLNGSQVEGHVSVNSEAASWATMGHAEWALPLRRNLYPRPMAGDVVVPVTREAALRPRIFPRLSFDAGRLFQGDDLSESGRGMLRAHLKKFSGASGRLLVEAHSQTPGDRTALRRETQLRAETVAQFVSREMGVDPERIVALGFGSDGLTTGSRDVPAWPDKPSDETIVLRVLP